MQSEDIIPLWFVEQVMKWLFLELVDVRTVFDPFRTVSVVSVRLLFFVPGSCPRKRVMIMIQIQNNQKIEHLSIYQIYLDSLLKIDDDMIMAFLIPVHWILGPVHLDHLKLEENDRGHVDEPFEVHDYQKPYWLDHVMNVYVLHL